MLLPCADVPSPADPLLHALNKTINMTNPKAILFRIIFLMVISCSASSAFTDSSPLHCQNPKDSD
jgi:hypothetical protein